MHAGRGDDPAGDPRKAYLDTPIKLHVTKCSISGPPETGKSRFRALMLGLKCPEKRQSTAIATEADQVTLNSKETADGGIEFIDMSKIGNTGSWTKLKSDSMARFIANAIYEKIGDDKTDHSSCPKKSASYFKIINDIKRSTENERQRQKKKKEY